MFVKQPKYRNNVLRREFGVSNTKDFGGAEILGVYPVVERLLEDLICQFRGKQVTHTRTNCDHIIGQASLELWCYTRVVVLQHINPREKLQTHFI